MQANVPHMYYSMQRGIGCGSLGIGDGFTVIPFRRYDLMVIGDDDVF